MDFRTCKEIKTAFWLYYVKRRIRIAWISWGWRRRRGGGDERFGEERVFVWEREGETEHFGQHVSESWIIIKKDHEGIFSIGIGFLFGSRNQGSSKVEEVL